MNNKKIIKRLQQAGWKDKKKVEWTRKRALETINYVIEMNQKDMQRIDEAYQTEIDLHEAKLLELAQIMTIPNIDTRAVALEMQEHTAEIARLKKTRRTSSVNSNGILNAARVLNRMFGYDITKVEINQADEERENMQTLSIEELKAIAYANINGSDTNKS